MSEKIWVVDQEENSDIKLVGGLTMMLTIESECIGIMGFWDGFEAKFGKGEFWGEKIGQYIWCVF